ncbi:MAG: hypothetical protein PHU01_02190, partial [Desulfuromonadaceae bacterium]|nr:hypothetical protein [Desulfuromonadaceae bacterium]
GTFHEAAVEVYDYLMDCECPKCPSMSHLAIVCFPTNEETEANWDKVSDADKKAHIDGKNHDARWLASRLSSESELPDIDNESILLTWDEREGSAIILYNEQELWREPVFFEGYPRYEEVVGILRGKYGDRLADVIPTDRSIFNLYGDKLRADSIVGGVRSAVQRNHLMSRPAVEPDDTEVPGFSFFDKDDTEDIDAEDTDTEEINQKEKERAMAFSTKIFSYPIDTTKPTVEIEPNWWNSRELKVDPRFVACGPNSSYNDYEAYLTVSEMMELHEKYRPQAVKDCELASTKDRILPKLELLDEILYVKSDLYSRFRVYVFEWESGY